MERCSAGGIWRHWLHAPGFMLRNKYEWCSAPCADPIHIGSLFSTRKSSCSHLAPPSRMWFLLYMFTSINGIKQPTSNETGWIFDCLVYSYKIHVNRSPTPCSLIPVSPIAGTRRATESKDLILNFKVPSFDFGELCLLPHINRIKGNPGESIWIYNGLWMFIQYIFTSLQEHDSFVSFFGVARMKVS